MKIVVDSSVLMAVAMNEPEKKQLVEQTKGHELLSPELLPYELGNALSAMLKRKRIKKHEVGKIWTILEAIPIELRQFNIEEALQLCCQYDIYAYDAYFLQCAIDYRLPIISLDKQLNAVASKVGIKTMEIKL